MVTQLTSERILHSWVEVEERSQGRYSNLDDCSGLLDFEGCAEQSDYPRIRKSRGSDSICVLSPEGAAQRLGAAVHPWVKAVPQCWSHPTTCNTNSRVHGFVIFQ